MKYQFSIRIKKKGDLNSAASKAVLDCNALFAQRGYKDYNLVFDEQESKFKYYLALLKELVKFYFVLEKDSVVGVQYPMLNNIFKYFIKAAKRKNIKFFCIIHDIESLRLGGKDKRAVELEATNLNYYDCVIVHNSTMMQWLSENGTTTKMIPLSVFDYLSDNTAFDNNKAGHQHTIAFAGNLTKSAFVYSLSNIPEWYFNLYGPNFKPADVKSNNIEWQGEFSPDQVVHELKGDYGLIWDGTSIEKCDDILGNYLRYNNPHKFSLYIAAGLPVVAPADSAIGQLIKEKNLGVLVTSLNELKSLNVNAEDHEMMRRNVAVLQEKITKGYFFLSALDKVESMIGVS